MVGHRRDGTRGLQDQGRMEEREDHQDLMEGHPEEDHRRTWVAHLLADRTVDRETSMAMHHQMVRMNVRQRINPSALICLERFGWKQRRRIASPTFTTLGHARLRGQGQREKASKSCRRVKWKSSLRRLATRSQRRHSSNSSSNSSRHRNSTTTHHRVASRLLACPRPVSCLLLASCPLPGVARRPLSACRPDFLLRG